jgi:hypothetical protein
MLSLREVRAVARKRRRRERSEHGCDTLLRLKCSLFQFDSGVGFATSISTLDHQTCQWTAMTTSMFTGINLSLFGRTQ